METGYIKLYRSIYDNGIWQSPVELRLFLWIIGQAVFSTNGVEYSSVNVQRGQYLRSYRKLREDLWYRENNAIKHYSKDTIKRNIRKLESKGMIQTQETGLCTLFTVVNYEKYQGNNNEISEMKMRLETGHKTVVETALIQQPDNNKKDKKEKNDIYMSKFDEARKIYLGTKRGLQTEFNNFIKQKDWEEAISLLRPAIAKEINYKQELINQGKFCPDWKNFQTWINNRCWEQELPQIDKSNNNQKETIWNPA